MNVLLPDQKRWLTALLLAAGWLAGAGCKPSSSTAGAAPPPPPPVTVAKPIQKEIVEWDEYTGRTDAVESVDIRPRVSGYIDNITFKAGDLVNKGDLLFVIDPRPYQAVLDQDNANLRSADTQRQLQAANLARAERLFQTRVSSKEEYDTSLAQKNQAEAQYYQAQATVNAAQLNLDFTQIKAPISGRISRELVTVGNLVQGDSTVLTTVVSVDPIYAYFNVDERTIQKYIDQVKHDQRPDSRITDTPVYLQLENETGFPHEGIIDFINNTYNSSTGTLQIRGRFHNDDGFLLPGAFVNIRLPGTPKFQGLLITDRAVGTDQGQKFVLVVDSANTVQSRPVELGPLVEGLRVVRSGLGPEDVVIINGLVNARPGGKVTPQPGHMDQFRPAPPATLVSVNKGAQRPGEPAGAPAAPRQNGDRPASGH
ncbi:MAG TPA: efflux RND transporter periplasmic adaptor subunit [Chthoniobacterales bacterium]